MQHNPLKRWVRLQCRTLEVIVLRNSRIVKKKVCYKFSDAGI